MSGRNLQELLQQAEHLASNLNGGGDLPRVDRSLQQILHTGQQLWSRPTAPGTTESDAQAAILLGSRGIDLPHISTRLDDLVTAKTLQPLEAVADTDIAAFLRNERENAIITAVEDSKRRTCEEVDKLYWKQQQAEWEQRKQHLLSAFTHTGTDLLNITVQQQESIVTIPRTVGGVASNLSSEETAYVRVIQQYNEEVLQGGIRPNLPEALNNAASALGDQVDCDSSPSASTSSSSSAIQDTLSLNQLQNLLYEQYGEAHFNAWQQPLLYTSLLLMTGQFEAAIEFLSRKEALRCHAVHIALALHEMNLLALPAQVQAPVLSREDNDPEGVRRLNLTRLILLYTRKFEATDPCEALHYCFFLRSLKGKNGENVFSSCISQLVLQSREFDLLLGRLEPDGRRTPGVIDKFKVDVSEVTEMVAQDSEKKGLYEDAVKLYDLAKNHEKVVALLNQLLSQVVHQTESGSGSQRGRVLELATAVALRFKTHGHNSLPHNAATLHLLLDLSTFFELYHKERFNDALEVLKRLHVIALRTDEVETRVNGMSSYGSEVRNVLPHVLLAAMTTTHRLYCSPPVQSSPQTSFNTSALPLSPAFKHLKEQARAIVTFAGMIPMRLHSEINARLVQLEALIN